MVGACTDAVLARLAGLATVSAPLLHEGPPRRSGDRDIRSNRLSVWVCVDGWMAALVGACTDARLGWPGLATVAAPLLHEGPPRRSGDRGISHPTA